MSRINWKPDRLMLNKKTIQLAIALVLVLAVMILIPGAAFAKTSAPGSQPINTRGKVMLLGGAMQDDNAEVYNALRAATSNGTTIPRIAVICSASPDYDAAEHEWSVDDPGSISYQHLFEYYGFEPVFIPVALDNYGVESYNPKNIELIKTCAAVFFNGGWQERHTRCMYKDDGSETPVMTAVRELYERGGVISGTSAGCAVQGATTYGDGNSYGYLVANHMIEKQITDVNTADPKNKNNGGYVQGLGFTAPYDALCDSHFEAQGRFARPIVAMREIGTTMAFGVDENTGFLLNGDTGTVFGAHGVTIFNSASATYGTKPYFIVSGVIVSYLTTGDTYTFSTKTVRSTKPSTISLVSAYASKAIFSPYETSKVMTTLVRSTSTTVRCTSAEKNPRFILTFTKISNQTKGYYDPATGQATVANLKVDIDYSLK